jgi:hypothetical protein
VGSCFEVFIVRNPMMRSEFNFDVWLVIYRFFKFQLMLHVADDFVFSFAYMHSSAVFNDVLLFCG